jgi:hypothetical protein
MTLSYSVVKALLANYIISLSLSKGVYNRNRNFRSLVEIAISPGIIVQDRTPSILYSTWLSSSERPLRPTMITTPMKQ